MAETEQRLVQLLLAVATASNEADTPDDAFQTAVDQICGFIGWSVGHVYHVQAPDVLVSTSIWHFDDPARFAPLREATDRVSFRHGDGSLPGRAFTTQAPVWLDDVAEAPGFVRAAAARRAGLHRGMAFPVFVGRTVVAVMEFFARETAGPDEALLRVMASIGGQLGRVVEREQARQALKSSEERFRTLVEEVQDYAIFMLDPEGRVASWNKGGERAKGYREDEIVGRHFSVFYPPEDVAARKPERELETALAEGRAEDEGWRVRKDGSRFWANVVITALHDEAGTLRGFSKVTRDLTERRRTEQVLRESERRLARAQEIAHVGSWEWDLGTNEVRWSDEMYRIYGMEPGEGVTFEKYAGHHHPADRERAQEVVATALRTREPYRYYHRILRAGDGAERVLLGEGEVIVDGDGRIVQMFGTAQDVTEQQAIEEELRERERLLRRAQEIAHFGSWEWNSATGELTWSDELYRIYGLEPGTETSYERYLERVHPDDRAHVQTHVAEALRTHRPFAFEERVVRPDGSLRTLRSAGEVMLDPDGIVWLFGVCHDVTETVEAEAELRESERRFRLLAENMTDLVSLHAPEGCFNYASPSAERILGYQPDELVGRDLYELIHPDDVPHVREASHAPLLAGEPHTEVTYRMRTKAGAYVWLDTTSKPILDDDGRVARLLSSSRNVTERVRAEQVQAHYRAVLEARNRELQDFAYVASHDLQEPLRKIRAFSDLLIEDYAHRFDEQGRHYLDRMDDAAARMSDLIADLLSFSRITTRGNPFESVDLNQVARDVLADLELAVADADGEVAVEALPTIEADPVQMRQLLQNLVANALKFRRPDEPPRIQVSARLQRRNESVHSGSPEVCRIEVRDNGIGFDEKYLDRIFTPFQRLHHREVFPGTGMGLAICRRIVERHGGTISARSKPEGGSTFIVVLPVRQETELENEPG